MRLGYLPLVLLPGTCLHGYSASTKHSYSCVALGATGVHFVQHIGPGPEGVAFQLDWRQNQPPNQAEVTAQF